MSALCSGPAGAQLTRWPLVIVAILAGLVAAMQIGKMPPSIGPLQTDFALGLVTLGWVASCFNATGTLFGAAFGVTSDRFGHRRSVLLGLVLLALGGILGALAADGGALLLARFIEGIGFVVVVTAAPALITTATRAADRSLVLAGWSTYMPTGVALMMVLAPPLLHASGWRGLWWVNVGLLVGFAALFAWVSRHPVGRPARSARRPLTDIARVMAVPGPWLLAACFSCYTLQWFAVMTWLPTFLIDQFRQTPAAAAWLGAAVVLINVPGNLLGGWLLRRGTDRGLVLTAAFVVIGLAGTAVFVADLGVQAKYASALLFSAVGGLIPSALLSAVPVHAASARDVGLANGVVVQGSNLGALLGPPLFATLLSRLGGWGDAGWALLFAAAAGATLALSIAYVERRATTAASGSRPAAALCKKSS